MNKKNIKDVFIATRPLSLTLAIYSTTLGIIIAHMDGYLFKTGSVTMDLWKIFLVTIAGILVQTATNLINDFFECEYKYREQSNVKYKFLGKMRTRFDIFIFLLGIACFGLTALIGIYLVYISSRKLLLIGIMGIIGGYSYTGEPIVYKRRGLGTVLSFILMGPLMVYGSYVVFSDSFSLRPILLGMPVSLLIPVLMLSNELRDYERDKRLNIKTLTVRIGFINGKKLYLSLIILSYLLVAIYVILSMLPIISLTTFITIPLAVKSYRKIKEAKKGLVPITNKLHLIFGFILIISMIMYT
ncbi:hypothetical protein BET03_03630 [Thermohalobacter berrensis]|uniref:1,4-dihydroxy-2-naphthoate octaprenyltransferase n=1 Tax=Thermohalobacter berrensis TaxID=99594 RepID=A0A419T138_9FIRM|nr:hypothetical protein BET03_03630 [Thermohalobacter berrensis]